MSDPRAGAALPGLDGAGPGRGARMGRGNHRQCCRSCGRGSGCGFQASSREGLCPPVTQVNKHVQEGPNQCGPAAKPNLLSSRPVGISWCLCLPGPRAGQEGEGTFLLIKEVPGLGETWGHPALSVNTAVIPVSYWTFPEPPAKVVPTSSSQA